MKRNNKLTMLQLHIQEIIRVTSAVVGMEKKKEYQEPAFASIGAQLITYLSVIPAYADTAITEEKKTKSNTTRDDSYPDAEETEAKEKNAEPSTIKKVAITVSIVILIVGIIAEGLLTIGLLSGSFSSKGLLQSLTAQTGEENTSQTTEALLFENKLSTDMLETQLAHNLTNANPAPSAPRYSLLSKKAAGTFIRSLQFKGGLYVLSQEGKRNNDYIVYNNLFYNGEIDEETSSKLKYLQELYHQKVEQTKSGTVSVQVPKGRKLDLAVSQAIYRGQQKTTATTPEDIHVQVGRISYDPFIEKVKYHFNHSYTGNSYSPGDMSIEVDIDEAIGMMKMSGNIVSVGIGVNYYSAKITNVMAVMNQLNKWGDAGIGGKVNTTDIVGLTQPRPKLFEFGYVYGLGRVDDETVTVLAGGACFGQTTIHTIIALALEEYDIDFQVLKQNKHTKLRYVLSTNNPNVTQKAQDWYDVTGFYDRVTGISAGSIIDIKSDRKLRVRFVPLQVDEGKELLRGVVMAEEMMDET